MKTFFQLREEKTQVTVGDYTTKHFDMCPSAVKLYSNIKNMTPMVHLVVENMMLHDLFFRLEKQAVAQGSIDYDDLEKADEYAEMIMDNAEQMGLEEEHSYIEDVHMAKFEQLAGMSDDEEEDDSEEDMNEKTLTPAELKKRKEVADAIKRENPNMPMAKKMAIATATAKKVAEATLRLDVNKASNDELKQYVKKSSTTIARSPSVHPDVMHTHDAAQKELKKRQKMQEEAEQIDEISRDLARRYIRKVADKTNTGELSTKQVMKRRPGVNLAGKKAYPGVAGEPRVRATESVTLDELSKKTLGSYVKKASSDMASNAYNLGARDPLKKPGSWDKAFKRKAGIEKATDKITKEEAENLDELSKKTLGTYVKKAAGSAVGLGAITTAQAMSSKGKADPDDKRQLRNRMTGVSRATDRLTKEETELDEVSSSTLLRYSVKSAMQGGGDKGDKRIAGQKMADEKLRKKHGNSSTARVAAGPARRESVEIDEVSQAMKDRYIQKSMSSHGHNAAVASDAKSRGDQATYDKARKIMKKRNQGMTRAFGGERA